MLVFASGKTSKVFCQSFSAKVQQADSGSAPDLRGQKVNSQAYCACAARLKPDNKAGHIGTVGFQNQMFSAYSLYHLMQFFGIRIGNLPCNTQFKPHVNKGFGFLNATAKSMSNPALLKALFF